MSSVVVIGGAAEFRLEALISLGDPSRPFIIHTLSSDLLISLSASPFVSSDVLITKDGGVPPTELIRVCGWCLDGGGGFPQARVLV